MSDNVYFGNPGKVGGTKPAYFIGNEVCEQAVEERSRPLSI